MHSDLQPKKQLHLHDLTWTLISYFTIHFAVFIHYFELGSCISYEWMHNKLPQNLATYKNKNF